MIVNYTYRTKIVEGRNLDPMADLAARLMRSRPYLIGFELTENLGYTYVTLRVTDIDRWRIKAHAGRTIVNMARRAGIRSADVELYGVAEVANKRTLQDGEGRTPRPRRPRSGEPSNLVSPAL